MWDLEEVVVEDRPPRLLPVRSERAVAPRVVVDERRRLRVAADTHFGVALARKEEQRMARVWCVSSDLVLFLR